MPTEIAAAFEEFAARLHTLPTETAAQAGHRISIEACLKSTLGMKSMFMSGSFGRGTNIPKYSDVDRFAVLSPDLWESSSRVTLVKVLRTLNQRFRTTSVRIDAPGVRIDFVDGEDLN
jgi:predicted nucleotidyltransferase